MKIGNELLLLEGAKLKIEDFGIGSFAATPSYLIGVNSSGEAVEVDPTTYLSSVPTLQEVTDEGATTSNNLTIGNSTTGFSATFNRGLKVGSASGWVHYFSAGNANIIGNTTVIESSLLLSPNAPDATTTNFRFLNTNNKLTTATVVAGVTLSDKHFTIDSDGDIGMNTLSPSAKLHVVGGAANETGTALLVENGAGLDLFDINDSGFISSRVDNVYFRETSDNEIYLSIANNDGEGQIDWKNNGVVKSRIRANGDSYINGGNLGIGTTSPDEKLHVDGNVKADSFNIVKVPPVIGDSIDGYTFTTGGSNGNIFTKPSFKIQHTWGSSIGSALAEVNTDFMVTSTATGQPYSAIRLMGQSGDIGINTASPIAKLHVVGGGNTSSTIAFQVENNDGGDILYLRDDGLAQFHNAIKIVSEIPYLQLSDTTLGSNHYINSNNANLRIQSTGEIEIRPTQAEVARFTDKGLSINGVSSSSKLYVKGDGVLSTNFLVEDADGGTGFIVYNNHEVGIGTNVVASILHIKEDNGYVFSNAGLTLEQAGTGDCVMQYFLSDGSSSRWVTGIDNSDGDKFKIAQNTNLGSDTRLTIADGGNIGIGVTNPDAKLSIVSSSGADAFVAENNGGQEVLRAGLIAGDITTGGNQIFYQGVFSNNYTGDMDSFNGFRVGRFKGNGSLNQAFNAHHNVLNLPNDSASVYDIQLAFETTGGAVLNGGFKFRNSSNSNWSEWYTVYHSGNGQTYQDVIDASASSVSYPTIATTYTIITSDSDKDVISIDYKINDGTNYRTGTVTAITNGTTTSITDTTKAEIGDTSGAVFISDYSGSVLTIKVTTNDSGWDAKYIIKNF